MSAFAFPFSVGHDGRTTTASLDAHIRQLIELVLFTAPGERVNRPDFGSGIQNLVFAGNSAELAAATQFEVQGALQQWLGDLVAVEKVEVRALDNRLDVGVQFVVRASGERRVAQFSREVGP